MACTINYFQIAYCLQCEVAKQLNFTKLHFYTDPQLINITIGLAFGRNYIPKFFDDSQKQVWEASKFDFDVCLEELELERKVNPQDPSKINSFWQKTFQKHFKQFSPNPSPFFRAN